MLEPPCLQTSGSDECQLSRDGNLVSPVHTVYVGNLAAQVNERNLYDAFSVCGPICSMQVRLPCSACTVVRRSVIGLGVVLSQLTAMGVHALTCCWGACS